MRAPRSIVSVRRSKEGKHEMNRRLRSLSAAVGRWISTLTNGGQHPADVDALSPELRRIVRAHDRCDWVAIEEDLAPEDGA